MIIVYYYDKISDTCRIASYVWSDYYLNNIYDISVIDTSWWMVPGTCFDDQLSDILNSKCKLRPLERW